jgi:hypothetical protein
MISGGYGGISRNTKVDNLVREIKHQRDDYLQANKLTVTEFMQSSGYAAGYGVGLARRLAGKKPTLNILTEHNVTPAEFMVRVNAHGGTFAEAVNAVLDEIERGGLA